MSIKISGGSSAGGQGSLSNALLGDNFKGTIIAVQQLARLVWRYFQITGNKKLALW